MPYIDLGVLVHALIVIIKNPEGQRNYPARLCVNSERAMRYKAFSSEACPGLDPGWAPVRAEKTRQTKAACKALAAEIGPAIAVDSLPVDVAGARAAQEPDRCGDVFRPAALAGDGVVD